MQFDFCTGEDEVKTIGWNCRGKIHMWRWRNMQGRGGEQRQKKNTTTNKNHTVKGLGDFVKQKQEDEGFTEPRG